MTKSELQRMWAATRHAVTVDDAYSRAYDVARRGEHILRVDTAALEYLLTCRLAAAMARLRFAVDPLGAALGAYAVAQVAS